MSFVDVFRQPNSHILSSANCSSFWVKKDSEVLDLNLNSLLAVSRLFAHYSWSDVKESLEEFFQSQVFINPFMDDKALIKVKKDLDPCLKICKWKIIGRMHLKLDHWSNRVHSKPEFLKCYGGWVRIRNLPLAYWKSLAFVAIRQAIGWFVKYLFTNT